jgi:hypothetical protein
MTVKWIGKPGGACEKNYRDHRRRGGFYRSSRRCPEPTCARCGRGSDDGAAAGAGQARCEDDRARGIAVAAVSAAPRRRSRARSCHSWAGAGRPAGRDSGGALCEPPLCFACSAPGSPAPGSAASASGTPAAHAAGSTTAAPAAAAASSATASTADGHAGRRREGSRSRPWQGPRKESRTRIEGRRRRSGRERERERPWAREWQRPWEWQRPRRGQRRPWERQRSRRRRPARRGQGQVGSRRGQVPPIPPFWRRRARPDRLGHLASHPASPSQDDHQPGS